MMVTLRVWAVRLLRWLGVSALSDAEVGAYETVLRAETRISALAGGWAAAPTPASRTVGPGALAQSAEAGITALAQIDAELASTLSPDSRIRRFLREAQAHLAGVLQHAQRISDHDPEEAEPGTERCQQLARSAFAGFHVEVADARVAALACLASTCRGQLAEEPVAAGRVPAVPEDESPSDDRLPVVAGRIVLAYIDEYLSTSSEPDATSYIARAPNGAVEKAVRLHIDTARVFWPRIPAHSEG
ncbi:MAG: hypothetical protein FJX75_24390 [Armatimonadetes bacterium]|nr:hypothetical protein [Armatimonadota bacterium]